MQPPVDHTCWRTSSAVKGNYIDRKSKSKVPGFIPLPADISTEETCPACQWLIGYHQGLLVGLRQAVELRRAIASQ